MRPVRKVLERSSVHDLYIYAILVAVNVLSRLPFLDTFELVAYDGTFYLKQAETLLEGTGMAGAFPIGYPASVALFNVLFQDLVLAGQFVSFVAGVGSTIVIYLLGRHYLHWQYAFLCALLLALNPLFIRLSLMTLSESLYVFWVLLGTLMMVSNRHLLSGLSLGVATVTRPEALAIVGVIALARLRKPTKLLAFALPFVIVYSINSVVLSRSSGRVVVLPKSEFIGVSSESWKLREAAVEFEGREDALEELAAEASERNIAADYARRLPAELLLLIRQVFPALFLLALFGMYKRKNLVLLAALVPLFVVPLGTVRSAERYLLPYVPFIIIYGVMGLDLIRHRAARWVAQGLVVLSIVTLPIVNRAHLVVPEERGLLGMKKAGLRHRGLIESSDKVADRKPYFAFYAGGEYLEIPVAPYEDVMRYLLDQDVRVLALHRPTIHTLRPALRPLLYSRAVINGELRFRQTYFDPGGEMIFMRDRQSDPLTWSRLTDSDRTDLAPAWSPDGARIAFRSNDESGGGAIYLVDALEGRPERVFEDVKSIDALAWSPDGTRVAFATARQGNMDILTVDVESKEVAELVSSPASDRSPSWCAATDQVAFCSDRSGQDEIWVRNLRSGESIQLTHDGGNSNPAFSPSGGQLAYIKQGRGLFVLDLLSKQVLRLPAPARVAYTPAWNPDGSVVAVTAEDWGSWDVYLAKADGTNALLLTKNPHREGMPQWRPDGKGLVIFSEQKGSVNLWLVGHLQPYLERLENPQKIDAFRPPQS